MIKAKIRDGDGEWDGVRAWGREAALSTSDWFPKSLALPGPSAPGVRAKPAWRRAVLPSSRTHNACAHTQPPFPNTHTHTHSVTGQGSWTSGAPPHPCRAAAQLNSVNGYARSTCVRGLEGLPEWNTGQRQYGDGSGKKLGAGALLSLVGQAAHSPAAGLS